MQVDPYIFLEEIGSGAHGVVYKGYHKENPNEIVAIKVIFNSGNLDTLLIEPKLLSQLNHPNIISIKDYFLDSNRLILVTEYIDGDNLQSLLDKRGKLLDREIKSFLIQIASALDYAHSQNIVHRDIKLSNILVDAESGEIRFVLADFGVSRISQGIQTTKHTAGTYSFMAPEQLRGRPCKQSDLWALGVCAYILFTSRKPFEGTTKEDLFNNILLNQPETINKINIEINPQIEEIIFKLLDKNLASRFSSAQSILDKFDRLDQSNANSYFKEDLLNKEVRIKSNYLTWEQRDINELRKNWIYLIVTLGVWLVGTKLFFYGFPYFVQFLVTLSGAYMFYLGQVKRSLLWTVGGIFLMLVNILLIDFLLTFIPEPLKLSLVGFLISTPFSFFIFIIFLLLFLADMSVAIIAAHFFTKIKKLRDNLFFHSLLSKNFMEKRELTEVLKKFVNVNWTNLNIRQKYIEFLLSEMKFEEAIVESKLALREIDPYNFNLTLLLADSYFSIGLYNECIDLCSQYLSFSSYSFEFVELRKQCQNITDSQ